MAGPHEADPSLTARPSTVSPRPPATATASECQFLPAGWRMLGETTSRTRGLRMTQIRFHRAVSSAPRLLAVAATALTMAVSVSAPAAAGPQVHQATPASVGAGAARGPAPATLTDALRCANPAHHVHFKRSRAVVAVAVGLAESNCVASATGHNGPTSGCPKGSDDRGLWQINSCYHPEVSDRCAYDPVCNARATKHISDHGKDWTPWSAYNSGAYRQYLNVAQQAVNRVYGGASRISRLN